MLQYIKNNLIAILALVISLSSFFLSLKNYLKAIIKFKITYHKEHSYSLGFIWYQPYKIIAAALTIENNSTSAVNISRIKLINESNTYVASIINVSDRYNENGISLMAKDNNSYTPINITSENILNNPRISSYGVLEGYAIFEDIEPLKESKTYKIVIETPTKSFSTTISIDPPKDGWHPINPLKD